jgi:hypothetical protein
MVLQKSENAITPAWSSSVFLSRSERIVVLKQSLWEVDLPSLPPFTGLDEEHSKNHPSVNIQYRKSPTKEVDFL